MFYGGTLALFEAAACVSAIQWQDQRRVITIGRRAIMLTPIEYRLLLPMRHGLPVTYRQLARAAYNYSLDEKIRALMDKHIDRIRGKLSGSGFYVYCVLSYGYILLPATSPDER